MDRKKIKILAIDDNKDNLTSIKAQIKDSFPDVLVYTALNGHDGFQLASSEYPDVILLDIVMPGMSGFEFCSALKADKKLCNIPIVFVTALRDDKESRIKALECGGEAFLSKPIDETELVAQINAMVKIKIANDEKLNERERLSCLVEEKTRELNITHTATLNLLEDLKAENEYRKKSEMAFQESESRFYTIFHSIPIPVTISDLTSEKYVEVNQAFVDISGYSKEEIIGHTHEEFNLWKNTEVREKFRKDLINDRPPRDVNVEFVQKNGSVRILATSVELVKLSEKPYLLLMGYDVTEKKIAEEKLIKSEQSLSSFYSMIRLMTDNTQDLLWAKDMNKNFTFVNKTTCDKLLIAKNIDEPIGKNDFFFVVRQRKAHPENPNWHTFGENCVDSDSIVIKEKRPMQFDEYGNVQGNFLFLEVNKAPIWDKWGKMIGIVGSARDVTQTRMLEQEKSSALVKLRESEEKYKTMVNTSPDGIILVNMKGIITEVSEIGRRLFGSESSEDLLGKKFFRFVLKSEKNTVKDIIERTKNVGLTQNISLTIRKRDKTCFAGETSTKLIQDSNGNPLSFMVILRDVSQRLKTEATLIHADRMAKLGEMAANIAHEINQPLNIISLAMDNLLLESIKTKSFKNDYLSLKSEKIFENISRMRNTIDHIRAFSRTHDDDVLTTFDLNTSIENAVSMISDQYKQFSIVLKLNLSKQLPSLYGNTYKFEQVILNLLSNARDAVLEMKSKQKNDFEMAVMIRSYHQNQQIMVEVIDNGVGIPSDDINNVILPFYTTKITGKGTGLGLSICYQILKEMNGTMEISSIPSHGTKIKIILELQKHK